MERDLRRRQHGWVRPQAGQAGRAGRQGEGGDRKGPGDLLDYRAQWGQVCCLSLAMFACMLLLLPSAPRPSSAGHIVKSSSILLEAPGL